MAQETKARLSIVQWREVGDDDDTVDTYAFSANDNTDALDKSLKDYAIDLSDHSDETPAYYDIWRVDIYDGDVITTNNKRYRINITEL